MTQTTGNDEPANNEPIVLFSIQTPLGGLRVNPADLPEGIRTLLMEELDARGLSAERRAALAKALGVDAAGPESGNNPGRPAGEHPATGCKCAETHREQVWHILDTAFPDDPHLWNAMEALFTLSAVSPGEITDKARGAALRKAELHIRRRIEGVDQPLDPEEQAIEQFRQQLGI